MPGKTSTKTKSAGASAALLARRMEHGASAKIARTVAEARRDIAFVRRRRAEVAEAFYDIGEALVRLRRRDVVSAMGCRSFAELCQTHVGISPAQATRFVDIVTNMSRDEALALGVSKASSLTALARAGAKDATVTDLLRHGARVSGTVVDVKKATVRAIVRAAAGARAANGVVLRGGVAVTEKERATCAALERALRRAGAEDVRVIVRAGRVVGAARATIEIAVVDVKRLALGVRVARPQ